jgi:hypothetical protein
LTPFRSGRAILVLRKPLAPARHGRFLVDYSPHRPAFGRPSVKNFLKKPEDIHRAVRLLRQNGVSVGVPLQTADGVMLFPVEDQTLTTKEILGLLERKELNNEGIRRLGAAKKGAR